MKKKQINRDKLLSSQSKSSMGVKIKSELANELKDLESKLDKKKERNSLTRYSFHLHR